MRSPDRYIRIVQVRKGFLTLLFALCTCFAFAQGNAQAKKILVHILDENGTPTAARIRVTVQDSIYIAPEGHRIDFPITEREGDVGKGGDVMLDYNRRFAYVENNFNVILPENQAVHFEAVKGFAYQFLDTTINISSASSEISFQLKK